MPVTPVTITTASVSEDFCPSTLREAWPLLVSLLGAEISGMAFFNYGNTTPSPDNQDKPWRRLNTNGTPDREYDYVGGVWLARHPVAPGTIIMYDGAEATIDTFDGGEAGTVSETTGPMWERVTALNARFPLGVGTLPSGAAVAVTNTGGEEKHTLIEEEIPAHTHALHYTPNHATDNGAGPDIEVFRTASASDPSLSPDSFGGDADSETVAHNTMPPYYAVFFLRKTSRLYYRL